MPRKSRLDKPLEWYPWNPMQWGASKRVQRMSWAQRGLYRELLDEYYLKGGLPADPQALADMLGEDADTIGADLAVVMKCFEVRDGRLLNETMDQVMAEQMDRRLALAERRRKKSGGPDADPDHADGEGDAPGPHGTSVDLPGPPGTSLDHCSGPGTSLVVHVADGTTRTGQDRTEQKETTTPAPPQAGAVKPKNRRTRKDVLADLESDGIPAEIVKGGTEILTFWHRKDPDGREIRSEADLLIPRLDAIVKRQPLFSIEVLVEAGRSYCEAKRQRYKAAQYFFSLQPDPDSEKPPFYEWAKAVLAKRQIAAQAKAQAPPPPPASEPQPATV